MKKESNVVIKVVSREMFPKHEVVRAIKWLINCTTKEAQEWYQKTESEYHNQVAMGFKMNQ